MHIVLMFLKRPVIFLGHSFPGPADLASALMASRCSATGQIGRGTKDAQRAVITVLSSSLLSFVSLPSPLSVRVGPYAS